MFVTSKRAFSSSPHSLALLPKALLATQLGIKHPSTPLEFLQRIGRNTEAHAPKFTSLLHLYTADSTALKQLTIPATTRKYILSRVEQMRKAPLTRIELPIREKRYLKAKAFITLERMRRGGNA